MEELKDKSANSENENGNEPKTYTEEELQALLQKEGDRRVTEALKKQERKNAEKVKEAEKLAKMNEEERFKYELDQREKAIADKERELALAENKATAASILADKGISTKLVDFVVAEDAETMNANISLLEKEFKASVKAEVEKRLSTTTPKKNLPLDNNITKEQFSKMKLTEQAALYQSNPELYKQLTSH